MQQLEIQKHQLPQMNTPKQNAAGWDRNYAQAIPSGTCRNIMRPQTQYHTVMFTHVINFHKVPMNTHLLNPGKMKGLQL